MQILTISIDGQSRADLTAALGEVLAMLQGGIDTSRFENERLSYSFRVKEYDLPADGFEQAAAEYQDRAERARYRYLPPDEVMAAAGYAPDYYGHYVHLIAGQWPRYFISFFSQSGTCALQVQRGPGPNDGGTVAAEVVATDEQLQQFLQRHEFPPIHPKSVGL